MFSNKISLSFLGVGGGGNGHVSGGGSGYILNLNMSIPKPKMDVTLKVGGPQISSYISLDGLYRIANNGEDSFETCQSNLLCQWHGGDGYSGGGGNCDETLCFDCDKQSFNGGSNGTDGSGVPQGCEISIPGHGSKANLDKLMIKSWKIGSGLG